MAGEGAKVVDEEQQQEQQSGLLSAIVNEVISSPVNTLLFALIVVLVYKIFKPKDRTAVEEAVREPPPLRCDLTPQQLKQYDGSGPDSRICIAIDGTVFDVTKGGKFYGPGGPYAAFAGRDATRGLATFSVTPSDKEYDDLSDLDSREMESVREWVEQFKERYKIVGRLLKPGEAPTNYSEEEAEPDASPSSEIKKNI